MFFMVPFCFYLLSIDRLSVIGLTKIDLNENRSDKKRDDKQKGRRYLSRPPVFLLAIRNRKPKRWSSISYGFQRLLAANMPPDNIISLGLASDRSPADQWRRDSVFSSEQSTRRKFPDRLIQTS